MLLRSYAVTDSFAPVCICFRICGRLSSEVVKITLIGCNCVITTMPFGQARRDVVARIDLAQTDAARHRRRDARVDQVELEGIDVRLVRLHRAFVLLDERRLRVDLLARDRVLREQRLIALQVEPRGLQQRLVPRERALRRCSSEI